MKTKTKSSVTQLLKDIERLEQMAGGAEAFAKRLRRNIRESEVPFIEATAIHQLIQGCRSMHEIVVGCFQDTENGLMKLYRERKGVGT